MRFNEFNGLLMDWASKALEAVKQSGYPAATTLSKCIELGAQGASIRAGGRLESNYWPNHKLILIDVAIRGLPVEDRNIIIMKRVYKDTYQAIGKKVKLSRWSTERRLITIEKNLYRSLK